MTGLTQKQRERLDYWFETYYGSEDEAHAGLEQTVASMLDEVKNEVRARVEALIESCRGNQADEPDGSPSMLRNYVLIGELEEVLPDPKDD